MCCDAHNGVDNGEGFLVCNYCGLAMDSYLSGPHKAFDYETAEPNIVFPIEQAIVDICENNHLGTEVSLQAVDLYRRIRSAIPRKWRNGDITAYSIFGGCIERELARLPIEIERMCDVPAGTICKISRLCEPLKWVPNTEYTERFCSALKIGYSDMCRIRRLVTMSKHLAGCRPQTINAAAIFRYCTEQKMKIDLGNIARVCSASEASITRLASRMKTDAVFSLGDNDQDFFFYAGSV